MSASFPVTSVTLIAKIKNLAPGEDSAAWVRFWDTYQGAIRQFAAFKGGEENADDIVMQVLAKLVDVLRSGQYSPEKGKFHSYLATMIVNEVYMAHRKNLARAGDRKVSLDETGGSGETEGSSLAETLVAPGLPTAESIDDDWRKAILQSAVTHVLNHTALSDRDRNIYREYVQEGVEIGEVAKKYGISRNYVSQIKVRIEKRIVAVGREMIEGEKNI